MLIAIVNQSTLVSDQDVATMTQAIAAQVKLDVAPLWDRSPAAVIFYTDPKNVPVAAHGIAVVDTIKDQPSGVLGYHTEETAVPHHCEHAGQRERRRQPRRHHQPARPQDERRDQRSGTGQHLGL